MPLQVRLQEDPAEARREAEASPSIGFVRHALAVLALVLACVGLYANALHGPFVMDNVPILLEDPRIRAATSENVVQIFRQDYWGPRFVTGNYRPLATLSYLFNYAILGNATRPLGYHVVNVVLHAANAVLVYLLASTLAGAFWPALWAGILFVAHPVATEAVTNVVGRADLMATLAVLAALLLHGRASRLRGRRAVPYLGGIAVVTAFGVLSKETAVALLGLLVVWDVLHPRRAVLQLASYVAVGIPLLVLWWVRTTSLAAALGPRMEPFGDNPLLGADFWTARATAIGVIGKELALLAWPRWLSCDYSYDEIPLVGWTDGWTTAKAAVALAVIVSLAAVAARARRTRPCFAFLIAFFFVALLPTSNLLLVIGSIMAERFLYLPSVAFATMLSLATFALFERARPRGGAVVASAVLAAVALAYGVRTSLRNRDWQDGVRLQASAVAAAPGSFKTHYGLAAALYANDAPDFRNIDAIIAEGEAALAIIDAKPLPAAFQPAVVPEHLGIYYWRKAETLAAQGAAPRERERWYEKAIALLARAADLARAEDEAYRAKRRRAGRDVDDAQTIGSPATYRHLGLAYLRLGRHAEALEAFASERGLQPDDADVYHEIAAVHAARGDLEGAATALFQAFAIAGPTRVLQPLFEVYRRMDGGECARGDDGGINLACPPVHRDVCRAYGELEGIFAARHLDGNARHVRDQAVRHLACPPGTFGDR